MPDKVLNQSALSLRNLVLDSTDAAILGATGEANLFRKENLLDERRSKRFRSNVSSGVQVLSGTFGETGTVSMLALMDSNLDTSATRLADAIASPQLWLKADTTSGTIVRELTDLSGYGRHASIDGAFGFFGRTQWHKADGITAQTDNTALSSWPDVEGGAVTGSGSTRPVYRTGSSAAGHNGLPVVEFSRSNSTLLDRGSSVSLGTTHSIIMRVNLQTKGTTNYLFGDGTSYVDVKASTLVYSAGGTTVTFTWTASTATWYTIAIVRSGTSVSLVVDGALISTQTLSSNTAFQQRYLGNATSGADGLGGYIAEWFHTTAVTTLAVQQGGAYLCRKYACSSFIPVPTVVADTTSGFNRVLFENSNTGYGSSVDAIMIDTNDREGISLGTSHTIALVFELTNTTGTIDLLGDTTSANGTTSYLRYSSGTITYRPAVDTNSTTGASVTQTLTASTRNVLLITRDVGTVRFRLNGVSLGTVTLDTSLQQVAFSVKGIMNAGSDGTNIARGYLSELFVSSSALSVSATKALEDHLASKWATSHTYSSLILETCSDSTFSSALTKRWTLQSYSQSDRRTLRWYLGAPDNVSHETAQAWTGGVSASYWRLKFPANGVLDSNGDGVIDSYVQIGCVWLGDYTQMPIDFGMTITIRDASLVSESDAGATFVDSRKRFHEITTTSTAMEESVTKTLIRSIESAGVARHCIFDLWATASDDTLRANGCYYGRLGGSDQVASLSRNIAQRDDVSFSFLEARA